MDHSLDPAAVVARFKVMAGVNVAERRLPQDGRMEAMIAGRKIDFRFSSLPTHHGESIVARVLDPRQMLRGLESWDFRQRSLKEFRSILGRPKWALSGDGADWFGKDDHSLRSHFPFERPSAQIVTVEDPVEYNLPGLVQQAQVHEEIGSTFARVGAASGHESQCIDRGNPRSGNG